MAAWDGQGRPEWGHGVNRRERRTDGTRIVYIYIYIYICFWGRLYPSSSSSVAVMVFLLSFAMCFLFCFGSLEIITGVSLVSESSSSFESSSFPDDDDIDGGLLSFADDAFAHPMFLFFIRARVRRRRRSSRSRASSPPEWYGRGFLSRRRHSRARRFFFVFFEC